MQVKGSLEGLPITLVGNQSDLEPSAREVSTRTGEALQLMWSCQYLETSAKTGANIHELFESLLRMETSKTLSLSPIEDKKKKTKKCSLL